MTGKEIFEDKDIRKKFEDAGIPWMDCTRIIIDIPVEGQCKIYTETILREKTIDVVCDIAVKIADDEREKNESQFYKNGI